MSSSPIASRGRAVRAAAAVAATSLAVALGVMGLPSAFGQTAYDIELLNPSRGTSATMTVSDKEQPYHINAWVNEVPPDPFVEFELIRCPVDQPPTPTCPGGTRRAIGNGVQVGQDVFDFFWQIPDLPDGTYVLAAMLFSRGSEVDRDFEVINLNHTNEGAREDPQQVAGETVEILYPDNSGLVGYYTNPAASTALVMEARPSSGTQFLRRLYTTSAPGTQPEWKSCGSPVQISCCGLPPPQTVRIRCTLRPTDAGSQVTGLALVANDTPGEPFGFGVSSNTNDDAADAHRVFPFLQQITSVTVAPLSATAAVQQRTTEEVNTSGDASCSPIFTFGVFDQLGNPIAGANVDVHATGPSDNLKFEVATGSSGDPSPNKPPERNHRFTETGYECTEGSAGNNDVPTGQQGEHNVAGADTKHVENILPGGTADNGTFRIRLHSRDVGITEITAWADRDDDDLYCAQEPAAHARIGWGFTSPPPDPTGPSPENGPTLATCVNPTPPPPATPTAGPTGSPGASPTASPGPTASPTGSPGPTASPTGSPGATQSPSPSPGTASSVDLSPGSVSSRTDQSVTLTATVRDAAGRAVANQFVTWSEDGPGQFEAIQTKTDANGQATARLRAFEGGTQTVTVTTDSCAPGGDCSDTSTITWTDNEEPQPDETDKCDITGTSGNDTLVGSKGPDLICGLGGNDTIIGGGGNDNLYGGAGRDDIRGGDGRDFVQGGKGADNIRGQGGGDHLRGGRGNDRINGGGGRDRCLGGPGRDRIRKCER